jgi:peptide deformylase
MYDASGLGLAAPQVGVLRRLVVIDVTEPEEPEEPEGAEEPEETEGEDETLEADGSEGPDEPKEPKPKPEIVKYVLINPEIVGVSEETVISKEGCLSVPGMVGVVERPVRVKVRAMDLDGNMFEVEGDGMLAKALLHEIDHLNGILYTDIAESVESVKPIGEDEAAPDE